MVLIVIVLVYKIEVFEKKYFLLLFEINK